MTTIPANQHYVSNQPGWQSWLRQQVQRWALRRAIARVYPTFAQQNPAWVDYAFDAWFLTHQAFPLFTRALEQHTWPAPVELANLWAEQFTWVKDELRQQHKTALIPAAAAFLNRLKLEFTG
jgi:hypothetical protein